MAELTVTLQESQQIVNVCEKSIEVRRRMISEKMEVGR